MMTKSEIISITLDELLDRFYANPESFEYLGDWEKGEKAILGNETIVWQTKINSGGELIEDPTSNRKTVVVQFSSQENSIKIYIFNQTFETKMMFDGQKADAVVESKKIFKRFGKNYRKFKKLRSLILDHAEHHEARDFLKKLASAFPNILDSHILGK